MTDPVDTDALFSDRAKQAAAELRAKANRNIARSKHDGRTERHSAACEGCQILGLMAEVDRLRADLRASTTMHEQARALATSATTERDRLRAVIENAPHHRICPSRWFKPCNCWKADAL